MTPARKKLIEVALPLAAINAASAREKSIRHGHPSTLHLWWARRPLAAARAVIFAQMVDDPSSVPEEFPTEAEQAAERDRLFELIEELVLWENTTNEKVLERARTEIRRSWRRACADHQDHPRAAELFDPARLPAFHDPFAGGGSLPLEAQRLGLEAYASDLNPVAVLINKAMIEIPPKFAGRPPVNPVSRRSLLLGSPDSGRPSASLLGPPASSRHAPTSAPDTPWRSRGYLPHMDHPGAIQSVTFRLADSLPADVVAAMAEELAALPESERDIQHQRRIAELLDRGKGDCLLGDDRAAAIVEEALQHFDGTRYRLLAWCVMPNHVHVLVEVLPENALSDIVHSWKSFTANAINRLLGRSGALWMREYHDRYVRDAHHFEAVKRYIEENPVKAGLAQEASAWRWGSAWAGRGRLEAGGPSREEVADVAATAALGVAGAGLWRGAQGLAEDVRYYGQWMRDEAEKRVGHLYPKVAVTAEMAAERPDLRPYVGRELTVIAWLWARTVKSPNPAFANVDVPLASSFMLSTKKGKESYVEPVIETDGNGKPVGYRFEVRVGKPKDADAAKRGTKLARGANFECIMSSTPISSEHIYGEANTGQMGARLMAIVAEGERGRVYLAPLSEHEATARSATPTWSPDVEMPANPRWFSPPLYGLTTYGDLFTPRQLAALTTFSDLVGEAMERARQDAVAAGLADDGVVLSQGGVGARGYGEAVGVYLAFVVSRLADRSSSICTWDLRDGQGRKPGVRNVFSRQAIPMAWDYAEASPLSDIAASIVSAIGRVADVLERVSSVGHGLASMDDAQTQSSASDCIVGCDPPYYDNIGYADLSDFFYVWLRRALQPVFPELFSTLAVPKAEELVATPYRHGSKEAAETFFLDGMTEALARLAEQGHPTFPVTIYYAFKQSERRGDTGVSSTGWETFLDAVIRAGFALTGTWPMRTELGNRMIGRDANALASSIVLVCRPRPADAPTATRREFLSALQAELPVALRLLQQGNIAPVDLAQAAIGPGMAVYTRYAAVLDAAGQPVTVRQALALINQTLDEALAEQEGDFDADTRWALAWFDEHGFDDGAYGVAETLSTAKNTSVAGMVEAGFLKAGRGSVRLLRPDELAEAWDPAQDARLTAWETVHHLARALETGGERAAAALVAGLGSQAEVARELAYRLYTTCERKKRASDALRYNALVQSWPEIARLAGEVRQAGPAQASLFGDA